MVWYGMVAGATSAAVSNAKKYRRQSAAPVVGGVFVVFVVAVVAVVETNIWKYIQKDLRIASYEVLEVLRTRFFV